MTSLSVAVPADFNRNTPRVDREACIARLVAFSEGDYKAGGRDKPLTADELNKQFDKVDLDDLIASQSAVGIARGEITYVDGTKPPAAVISSVAHAVFHSTQAVQDQIAAHGKSGIAIFSAINVDSVVRLSAQLPGAGISDYSQFVTSESEHLDSENAQVIFTGAYGKDRVTHDVNEYVGWLNEAALKRAAAIAKTGIS